MSERDVVRTRMRLNLAVVTALVCSQPGFAQQAPIAGEVRQIVTSLSLPGRSEDAVAVFARHLKPVYEGIPALRRFRLYREAESPEPLDLVAVSSYSGMAGMDSANAALRAATWNGGPALALYGMLSSMEQSHHDQFVEMMPALGDAPTESRLVVFEYVRVVPGRRAQFEAFLTSHVRPYEREHALDLWSETGRLLVADGWDYLRLHGVESLGAWQRYRHGLEASPFSADWDGYVSATKTIILRADATAAVR